MELTQQDYEQRYARIRDGEGTDEDRRLVKHYERQGFTHTDASEMPAAAPATKARRRRGKSV